MKVETLKEDYIKEFQLVKYMGATIFLYPFQGRSKRIQLCYYFLCFLFVFTSLQLFYTLCLTGFSDWLEIINIAPNMGSCFMSMIKYTTLQQNQELYADIFKHFRDNLWDLIPSDSTKNIQTFITIKTKWSYFNKFLLFVTFLVIIVVDSMPWLIMTYENKVLGKDLQYLYPFDAWYPFDKVKWFSVAYLWESLMTGVVIFVYSYANTVHLHIIAFVCMELTLLGNCLEDLISTDDVRNINKRTNLKNTHDNIKKNLKYIIKRHGFLDEISARFDLILGNIMFLSYSIGSVFICLTAFSFTVVDDLFSSIRYFFFFVALLVDTFFQCIVGQVLVDHSEAFSGKIYTSDWTYADAETKKILLMLILRTQKSFKLTAKGYLTMDLQTFSQICSTSYQFFNLLRTVYS